MNEIPKYAFALREDLRDEKQFLPTRGEPLATGWDVRAAMLDRKSLVIKPFEHVRIPLGFRSFCPEGWWYELKPRSSSFAKKNLHALYGTIDQSYPSELIFAAQYIPSFNIDRGLSLYSWNFTSPMPENLVINFGDALGQIIPVRRQEMETVEWSNEEFDAACKERNAVRSGGFGSTDKHVAK